MNQKVATLFIVLAAVVVVFVFLLLPAPPSPPAVSSTAGHAPKEAPSSAYSADLDTAVDSTRQGAIATEPSSPASIPWEDRLDSLLTTETDNATTVRGLVSSMRGLPPEAQEEFIAHAVNLCEDEQFSLFATVYFDPQTAQPVIETIFNDALNRPDEIKLPLMAKTLNNAAHPMAAEAREILEMYLVLEPGVAPAGGWDQAVQNYIREQISP